MKLLRLWLLRLSIPIQKLMQKMHPPEPLIGWDFVAEVTMSIEPGDVLLSRERLHLTNLFIPGFWSHAAIWEGSYVIEAIGSGVRASGLQEFLYKKDWVMVLRANFLASTEPVTRFAWFQVGLPYDYEFGSKVKAWYCSELVFRCLREGAHRVGGPDVFTLRKTFGVRTVTPQDFENAAAKGKFTIIADSRKT